MNLALQGTDGITNTDTDLNCYVSYNQYSSDIVNYTMFLSEAEYRIWLLCMFTGIDNILWAVFNTITLKTG